MRRTTLLLLCFFVAAVRAGSYSEILEEDALGLSSLEKNAAHFLRALEHKGGRPMTQDEMRQTFATKIPELTELINAPGDKKLAAIREWVRGVAPIYYDDMGFSTHKPLHMVLEKACEILALEPYKDGTEHPQIKAKEIVPQMRTFTRAVIHAFNRRNGNGKEEL